MSSVTVVVPTIPPRKRMLVRALVSVLNQTRQPEALIVEHDLLGEGSAPTRNRGVMKATTEYLAFLDDDDEFRPRHLENLLAAAEETGADVVYPWFDGINTDIFRIPAVGEEDSEDRSRYVTPKGRPWTPELGEWMVRNSVTFFPITALARTKLVQETGGFAPGANPLDACDDFTCWSRLVKAGAKFHHLDKITWRWNGHPGHTSGRPWNQLTEPSGSFVHHPK